MKFYVKIHRKNTKYTILAILGGCISITGYFIYVINPLELLLDKLLTLEPGSFLFKLWREPPYEVLAKIYVFNVTNSEEFLTGKEKLNFSEAGPYVYQEVLRNTEPTFNENGTLTFKPKRELILRKEYSIGDPNTSTIITPNVPLLGISSFVKNEYGLLVNLAFSSVANMLKSPSMKNLSIEEYLFGYEDPLVTSVRSFFPLWIDFSKFGIIDRLMALDNGNNTVTIHLAKDRRNISDVNNFPPYSINRFNGSPGLKQWGYQEDSENSVCNTIEGSFDTALFPRYLKENTTLRLYRRAFCRSVSMKYEGTSCNSTNLRCYSYRIDQNFLSRSEDNSENHCFCTDSKSCLPKGFGTIAPCYYGIPIAMSQPHYLNADPNILDQVNGLSPDKEKHDTVMEVSADFGVVLSAKLRFQINLRVSPNQIVTNSKPFEGMIIPLFWVELGMYEIPSFVQTLLHISNAIPTIRVASACTFGALGILLMILCLCCTLSRKRRKKSHHGYKSKYSPILILPPQPNVTRELQILR